MTDRPYFLRGVAPMPDIQPRPTRAQKVRNAVLNAVALLIMLAVVGIAFILATMPALPLIVPMPATPKQSTPAPPERPSTLGKNL